MHKETVQKPRNRANAHEEIRFEDLKKKGFPVWKAEFHTAINNSDDVPETMFSEKSIVPSRKVEMWWIPDGLLCLHKDQYFLVPSASVRYVKFKSE